MKIFLEIHSGDVNIQSRAGRILHPFPAGIVIHIAPESLFTSLRNDYSHAPESADFGLGPVDEVTHQPSQCFDLIIGFGDVRPKDSILATTGEREWDEVRQKAAHARSNQRCERMRRD
ncbi:MAG TPA: hypothetical protein VKX49_00810 [Bryobacteraceae bacterium]|jgi:hypothetical protein|nr:hypothetical protein [Bryobacteraceae bacterium]